MSLLAALEKLWAEQNFVCIGLDTAYDHLPLSVRVLPSVEEAIFHFNRDIVDSTHDLVCSYKPNSGFYEAQGEAGLRALRRTVQYIKNTYPHVPVILDAKRGDIGNTNVGYAHAVFDVIGADAVTVHPYLGMDALEPFLERKDKGIFVLVKTSNPGAADLQDLRVGTDQVPLYRVIARNVASTWNRNGNCGVVVGATYPETMRNVRSIIGDIPILIPGVGAQGGAVEDAVSAGKDSRGWGIIVNSSRDIIFASSEKDFAKAAREATRSLRQEINRARPN